MKKKSVKEKKMMEEKIHFAQKKEKMKEG